MLKQALVFLIIAIVAAVLGFSRVIGEWSWIAQLAFFVFIVLFVLALMFSPHGSDYM